MKSRIQGYKEVIIRFLFVAVTVLLVSHTAYAAKVVQITGKAYTQSSMPNSKAKKVPAGYKTIRGTRSTTFDISGKGKKTPVSVKKNGGKVSIFINNKKVLTKALPLNSSRALVNTTFLRLSNKKAFVFISSGFDDEEATRQACLYKYTGKKLVLVYDFIKDVTYPSPYSGIKPVVGFHSVSQNVITFIIWGTSKAIGASGSYIKFEYKSGSLKLKSRVVGVLNPYVGSGKPKKDTNYYRLLVNVPYYAKSTSTSKAGTLKAGTYYKINAMYFKKGVKRFQLVGKNKRAYWINASASNGKYGTVLAGRSRGQ